MNYHWFAEVLCWKHDGMIDSSTVSTAYVWLTTKFSGIATSAACEITPVLSTLTA